MSVMVLDAGNSIIKGKILRREAGEIAFPHAIRPLSESEYENCIVSEPVMYTTLNHSFETPWGVRRQKTDRHVYQSTIGIFCVT